MCACVYVRHTQRTIERTNSPKSHLPRLPKNSELRQWVIKSNKNAWKFWDFLESIAYHMFRPGYLLWLDFSFHGCHCCWFCFNINVSLLGDYKNIFIQQTSNIKLYLILLLIFIHFKNKYRCLYTRTHVRTHKTNKFSKV